MATLVPPPSKRQRMLVADKAREQQDVDIIPTNLGSIRIQFIDQSTGQSAGAPTSVPVADATVKNLELLLNTLQKIDASERIPYRFTYAQQDSMLDIPTDLYHSIIKPGIKTTEDSITLHYTPQAVFRVRAVNRCSSSIPGHGEAILCAAFSPASSSLLATGSGDSTARIWDCDTGTPKHTLKGHTSWVLVVAWSPDNTTLATGSMDNTVRLWNPHTGVSLGEPLKGHTKWATSLAWEPFHLWSPAERPRLASSSKDSTVRVWDVVTRRIELVLSGHKGSISCVRWGGTGNLYTSSHDKTVKIWSSSTGQLINTLSSHAHWVNHLALSTDFVLRTAFYDEKGASSVPSTLEARREKAQKRFNAAATINGSIAEHLVTASDDFTIFLWHPSASTKPIARLQGHQKQVNHVTFSPDGSLIASSAFDNHIKLWSARDGAFKTTLRGHVAPVYQSCFSADSRLLVSGSKDTTLKVWDMRTGKLKQDLPGHQDQVFAVDWSPSDGGKVGSGGRDRAVRIWRA